MKKQIKSFISITLSILILSTNVATAKEENLQNFTNSKIDSFTKNVSSRQEVVDIYENLLKTTGNQESKKQLYRIEDSETVFTGDFAILGQLLKEDETSSDIIYMKNESNMFANITYNNNSGIYTLMEVNEQSDDILFMVEEEAFRIVQDLDGSINMYSENGNILPVIEVTEDTGAEVRQEILRGKFPPLHGLETIEENNFQPQSSYVFGPYGNKIGPYRKTNKVWVDVLTIISIVGSGLSVKVKHPILGIIFLIVGAGAYVGDKIFQTFWLEYWQSFSLSPIYYYKYMLEESDWYEYNNYTGFVGSSEKEMPFR